MKKLFLVLLTFIPFSTFAYFEYDSMQAWFDSESVDEFSGEKTYSAYGTAGYYREATKYSKASYNNDFGHTFGLRCDVSKSGSKNFMIKFDGKSSLATPNTNVDLAVKVDDNKPLFFQAKLFSNSYRAGFVRLNSKNRAELEKLIVQAKAGNKILVRANDKARSDFTEFSASLRGFTKTTAKVLQVCNIGTKVTKMSENDKNRLEKITKEILSLEKEKESIHAKY